MKPKSNLSYEEAVTRLMEMSTSTKTTTKDNPLKSPFAQLMEGCAIPRQLTKPPKASRRRLLTRPPTHPGFMLINEFLEPRGLTQAEFAKHIGWSRAKLNTFIKGKHRLSPEMALTLEDLFGIEAEFWLNLQLKLDIYNTRQIHKKLNCL